MVSAPYYNITFRAYSTTVVHFSVEEGVVGSNPSMLAILKSIS